MARIIKKYHDGNVKFDYKINKYFFYDVDGKSSPFGSLQEAEDEYYLKQAYDYLGSAIRDNSRNEKILIGKSIDNGTFDQELSL